MYDLEMCDSRPKKMNKANKNVVSIGNGENSVEKSNLRLSQAWSIAPMRKTLEISQLTHGKRLALQSRHSVN